MAAGGDPAVGYVDTPKLLVVVLGGISVFFIVEFFLRPRIERRKEAMTARRELISRLLDMSLAATICELEMPATASALRDEKGRQAERLLKQAQELFDNSGKYLVTYAWPIQGLLHRALFDIHAVVLSRRRLDVKGEKVLAIIKPVIQMVEPPALWAIWRLPRLFTAPAQLKAVLDALPEEKVPRV